MLFLYYYEIPASLKVVRTEISFELYSRFGNATSFCTVLKQFQLLSLTTYLIYVHDGYDVNNDPLGLLKTPRAIRKQDTSLQ